MTLTAHRKNSTKVLNHFFLLWLFLFTIRSYIASIASVSPSPVIAQAPIIDHICPGWRSLSPSNVSISWRDRECCKSCLLAITNKGSFWLSGALSKRISSNLASSSLSLSSLSTTNIIPSEERVYWFHNGLLLSCPPTSHILKVIPFALPSFTLIVSQL